MANQPDLSLPDQIPGYEEFRYKPMELLPFALYFLYDIEQTQIDEYQQQCFDTKVPLDEPLTLDTITCPSNRRFKGLQSIIPYHVELAQNSKVDHRYLIVSVFEGVDQVLLVTLYNEDGKLDKLWIPRRESAMKLVSMRLGNGSWYEVKRKQAVAAPAELKGQD